MPRLIILTLFAAALFLPDIVSAQQLLACSGAEDCNFCTAIITIQNIINFVVLLAVILATIMLAITGFKMVASKGNPGAMKAAKDLLMNICIGVLLILAAWTLVDTLLKILVQDDIEIGLINFGPQYRIDPSDCGGAYDAGEAVDSFVGPSTVTNTLDLGRDGLGIAIQGSAVTMTGVQPNPGGSSGSGSGSSATLSGGGTAAVTACNTADMRTINFMGGSVTLHRSFIASAQRIDQRWRAQGSGRYRVYSVGSYNCRRATNSSRWSAHAYGLAIDINPAENPYGSTLVTDMPPEFINLFIAEGWGWGGNWRSVKDAMHFSKSTGEGGNMRGD